MNLSDQQQGKPQVVYKGTQSNIEAMTLDDGSIAYATDLKKFGVKEDGEWLWSPGLLRLGSNVSHDLQYMQNVVHSAGWVSGGVISDNGNGTIAVTAGIGLLRATDDNTAALYFCEWSAAASISLTDESDNWVYVQYNSGTPNVVANNSKPANNNTFILLARIYRFGTDLHIHRGYRHTVGDHAGLMMEAMSDTMPFANASGGAVSEVGTLQFSISAGEWWQGLTKFSTNTFDGTSDTFNYYYRDGVGGWTEVAGQTDIDPDHYDDGDGTLGVTSVNRYTTHWGFISVDSEVHVIYGRGNFVTLTQAQSDTLPSDLPPELVTDSRFLFKIIVRKGNTVFESIESVIEPRFMVTGGAGGAVESVNGQTGAVVLAADDIGITDTGAYYTATDVEAALQELAPKLVTNGNSHDHNGGDGAQIAHGNLSGLSSAGAHGASAISISDSGSLITATNVEDALQEMLANLKGRYYLPFASYADPLPITAVSKFPHLCGIDRDMTLISWTQPCRVLTTSDSSNYWTIQLTKSDGSAIASVTTQTVNTTDWKNVVASFSPLSIVSATYPILYTVITAKTGTPGSLYLGAPVCEVKIP